MNFLALVNRTRLECGVSGSDLASVSGQTGESARLIAWCQSAWLDIQSARTDWQWMRKSASFQTVAGQATYTPAAIGLADFGSWFRDTFRNYDTAAGIKSETFMDYLAYDDWLDSYQIGALRSVQTRPNVITITAAKSIGLGPVPAAGYTVTGDYFSVPSDLAANTDTPGLPAQFHMAIVYRAMVSYGMYEAAGETVQRGQMEFDKMMRRLHAHQMPEITAGGALC